MEPSDVPGSRPPGPVRLAIANQKGGVGKTTTAINLATALAATGRRTLLVDLDPQGNASTGLGLDPSSRGPGVCGLLRGEVAAGEAMRPSGVPGLDLLPGSIDLAGFDLETHDRTDRDRRLRIALADPVLRAFDRVLIDCPPALNLLTVNALVAADRVMIPLQCEFFALEGLSQLLRTIERIRGGLNSRLSIDGIVLTMYDRRNNLALQVESDVRQTLGDLVYETAVPRNIRLSEAPSHGIPALIYDHRCSGSRAYQSLAAEHLRRSGVRGRAEGDAA